MSTSVCGTAVARGVFVLCLVVALAGCGRSSDPDPLDQRTSPSPSSRSATGSSQPVDPSESTAASGAPDGWEDKFTADELRAYRAALIRWQRYNQVTEPIYREGKDTPEARAVLREYSLFWQRDIVTLAETYDKGGIREETQPEPLWVYAAVVKPGYVVIVQCTDYSRVRITKNGDVLDNKPTHLVTPLVVRMTKPDGDDWMFQSSELKDKKACAA